MKPRHRVFALLTLLGVLCLGNLPASADVQPHPLFCDGAVLQRGMKVPVWGTADDDEKVTVSFQGQTVSTTARQGKWQVKLEPLAAGGPAELTITGNNTVVVRDVLVGEVWICSGQSNMAMTVSRCDKAEEETAGSANSQIRLLSVPRAATVEPQSTTDVHWTECGPKTVGNFSGVGYFFGRDLYNALSIPIGLIDTSYGGTPAEAWTSHLTLATRPNFKSIYDTHQQRLAAYPTAREKYEAALATWKEADAAARQAGKPRPRRPNPPYGPDSPGQPAGLYNAMIAPLIPYAVRGAIWYQGESNAGRAYQYRSLFPAMITDWRDRWGQREFPFLFVQLAPFRAIVDEPQDSDWAELREAQLLTSQTLADTAMAVITDAGEEDDIHPKKKQPAGARLALAARAMVYGEDIEYIGPTFSRMKANDGRATLWFDHAGGGLESRGGELKGFTICGEDQKFVNAVAKIRGDRIVVSSPEVESPVAVRYGWADFPLGNLWSKAGLPASPFRTDDFPGVTWPK